MNCKIILSRAAAIAVCLTMSCTAFAADAYTENTRALANPLHENMIAVTGLKIRSGGIVDYVDTRTREMRNGKNRDTTRVYAPEWFHSENSGKTWTQMDTSWHDQLKNRLPKSGGGKMWADPTGIGKVIDAYIADNGDFYCMLSGYSRNITSGSNTSAIEDAVIIKAVDGKVQPDYAFIISEDLRLSFADVSESGDVSFYVSQTLTDLAGNDETYSIRTYDAKGALKSEAPLPADAIFQCLVNGIAYTLDFSDWRNVRLAAYNAATGANLYTVPLPAETRAPQEDLTGNVETVCATRSGTAYITTYNGLYRFDPAGKKFTQVQSRGACGFTKNMGVRDTVCAEDGSICMFGQYYNYADRDDPKNGTKKLYTYTPEAL